MKKYIAPASEIVRLQTEELMLLTSVRVETEATDQNIDNSADIWTNKKDGWGSKSPWNNDN